MADKKFLVKWCFTDYYGHPDEAWHHNWFDTKEEADAFIAKQQKGNGSWFYLNKVVQENYKDFQRMNELYEEYSILKERF